MVERERVILWREWTVVVVVLSGVVVGMITPSKYERLSNFWAVRSDWSRQRRRANLWFWWLVEDLLSELTLIGLGAPVA